MKQKMGSLPRTGGMAPRNGARLPKFNDPFYRSQAWKDARARQPDKWCAVCGTTGNLDLDHKVERKDGGADLDPANLQWLCRSCHQRKTAQARGERSMRGGVGESREG